jgi:hypothetical protein
VGGVHGEGVSVRVVPYALYPVIRLPRLHAGNKPFARRTGAPFRGLVRVAVGIWHGKPCLGRG